LPNVLFPQGQSEIRHERLAARVKKDIAGLTSPMNDPCLWAYCSVSATVATNTAASATEGPVRLIAPPGCCHSMYFETT